MKSCISRTENDIIFTYLQQAQQCGTANSFAMLHRVALRVLWIADFSRECFGLQTSAALSLWGQDIPWQDERILSGRLTPGKAGSSHTTSGAMLVLPELVVTTSGEGGAVRASTLSAPMIPSCSPNAPKKDQLHVP